MNGRGIKRPFNNPVWGQPGFNPMQQDMNMQRNGWGGDPMMGGVGPMMGVGGGPMMDSPMVHPLMNRMGEQKKTSSNRIKVLFDPSVKKTTLEKIFNIVPGFVSLEFIEMVTKGAVAGVTYDNPLSAQHAIERIQGLEYPADSPLELDMVPAEPEAEVQQQQQQQQQQQPMKEYLLPAFDAQKLMNVELPQIQPTGQWGADSPYVKGVWWYFNGSRYDPGELPGLEVHRNLWCRFGGLTHVHLSAGGQRGFATFDNAASASLAQLTVHKSMCCGYRLNVEEYRDKEDPAQTNQGPPTVTVEQIAKGTPYEDLTKNHELTKKQRYDIKRNLMRNQKDREEEMQWAGKVVNAEDYTAVTLPAVKPMQPELPIEKAMFFKLVTTDAHSGEESLPPYKVFSDLFCRFGSLVSIKRYGNRKGMANFGSAESANVSMIMLDGINFGGAELRIREFQNDHNKPFQFTRR